VKSEDQINQEMLAMLENVVAQGGMLDMPDLNNLWRFLSDIGSELTQESPHGAELLECYPA